MTITEGNDAIKSMEITDELLSLLRAINEKFNSGDGKPEDRASLGSKGKNERTLKVEMASEYHPGINGTGVRFLERTGAVSGVVYIFFVLVGCV